MASFRMVMVLTSKTGDCPLGPMYPVYSPKGPSVSRTFGGTIPSMTISARAGTRRSTVPHRTKSTVSSSREEASSNSSNPGCAAVNVLAIS